MTRISFKFSRLTFIFTTYRFSAVLIFPYKPSYKKCDAFLSCENPVFENTGKCALHCLNKSIEDEKKYLSEFSRLFKLYLLKKIRNLNVSKDDSNVLKTVYLKDLNVSSFYERYDIKDILSYNDICIDCILFPEMNFYFIIKEFKFVKFKNCIFERKLSVDNGCLFYELCIFNNNLEINADTEYLYKKDEEDIKYDDIEYPLRENIFRYQECVFKGLVSIKGWKDGYRKISYIYYNVFKDCDFKNIIKISGVRFRDEVIYISDVFEYIESHRNKKNLEVC